MPHLHISFISQMISSILLLCKNFYSSRPIQHVYFHPIPKIISITITQAPGNAPSHSLSHYFEKVSLLTDINLCALFPTWTVSLIFNGT